MKIRMRTLWRLAWAASALLAAAWLIVPQLNADRYKQRVQRSLEEALGRRVEIGGNVHVYVLGGPGVTVERVIINEDPAAGIEPFAYVESLEARVRLLSLFRRRLEFSSLRLVNPSLNLAEREAHDWNIAPLLGRASAAPAGFQFPEIQVRGGRINIKFGDTKSIFYLREASLDASPPAEADGEWRVRFEGAPARTDRPILDFSPIHARGRWRPNPATGGVLDLSVSLDRSSLGELIRLVHGHDIGVHGFVAATARLSGPLAAIRIDGRFDIGEIHRWDLLPPYRGVTAFKYSGVIDAASERLELNADSVDAAAPLSVAARASGFRTEPRWAATATLRGFPVPPVANLLRQMGLSLPQDLVFGGDLTGVLGYTPSLGFSGTLIGPLSIAPPGAPEVQLPRAAIVFEGPNVRLAPAEVSLGAGSAGRIEADYAVDDGSFDAVLTGRRAGVAETAAMARLGRAVPVLESCAKATWTGVLRYDQPAQAAGQWTGLMDLRDAVVPVVGLAEPVEIDSAHVVLRPDGVVLQSLRGHAGAVEFSGEYRYQAGAARPHQLRLSIPSIDAAELERLLAPSLRRDEGLLTRALRMGRARIPEWLASRHAAAAIQVESFTVAGLDIGGITGDLVWDGPSIEIADLSAQLEGGQVAGAFTADLAGPAPAYLFKGRFRNVEWAGGEWSGAGALQTAGLGAEAWSNLRIEASFDARSVTLAPDTRFSTISGDCVFSVPHGAPQLQFSKLVASSGDLVWGGKGATSGDGKLDFVLSSGEREMRMTGTVTPFKLDVVR